jgi:PAS domain S-box-containing protein/putative nucleotidyltransferase with HDIG domain
MSKLYQQVSRACMIETRTLNNNQIEITVRPKPEVEEKPFQCENRMGAFESISKLLVGKFAVIDHDVCMHKGGNWCKYIITWENTRSFIWKRITYLTTFLSLPACIILIWALSGKHAFGISAFALLLILSTILRTSMLEKEDLRNILKGNGEMAETLFDQINIRYNNAVLVKEIGQYTSSILDIDLLLKSFLSALEKNLDFSRGGILLANSERTRLRYMAGYGYSPEQEEYLRDTSFSLTNPDSRGAFVVSFKKQEPFLINDIHEIENELSQKSLKFAKKMGGRSFVCVPITYEGRSEGILAVDNLRSDRLLNETDISLLMGIAPQIGISINNARTYEKLRERERRFRILAESAPDIIFTLDTEGMFTYVNPVWEKLLGHKQEAVVGKYFSEFAQDQDSQTIVQKLRRLVNHKETQMDVLLSFMSRDGVERNFSFNCAPYIAADGHVESLVGILKDVTDLRRSEIELKKSFEKLQTALSGTINVISLISESRDPYTAGHQRKVAELASAIAREMGMSEDRVEMIHMAALIHDMGKIGVPAELLSRPGKLTTSELTLIQSHPEIGYNILTKVDFPGPIAQIVYQHHEKIDGSGYPLGISGDQIVLEARIITVADLVEAMQGHRPYRPALGLEMALEEISEHKGFLYDKNVVDVCLKLFREKRFHF